MQRMWEHFGYRDGDRRLVLRGLPLRNGQPVSYDPLLAELRVSPFRLGAPWLETIENHVQSFKPRFVHGYPSAVERFAEIWRGPLPRVDALLLASETLSSERWNRIEERWRAPVLSWYGHSEKQALGGNCRGNRAFHMFPTYGLCEIIAEGGRHAQAGEYGTIVATGFVSEALGLVRYETDDVARFVGWGCEACGLDWPLIDSVTGRWAQAPLIGRHGVPISMTALNFHSSVFEGVRRLRYVQEDRGRARLLLEADELSDDAKGSIERAIRAKVGDELDVTLSRVDEIPLTPSGKHVLVEQRIDDR
jgi:phenylacetate-CoA ligase